MASPFDLILFGNESADSGGFQVGIRVAHALGRPVVTGAKELRIEDGRAIVGKGVSSGLEVYEVPLPAVVTVKEGINLPRYPSVPGRLRARKKDVERLTPEWRPDPVTKVGLRVPVDEGGSAEILGYGPEAAPAVVELDAPDRGAAVSVLVLVEHADGTIDRISAETLAMARGHGEVRAVLFGSADGVAEELGAHGVSSATVVSIDGYVPMAWAAAFEQVARSSGVRPPHRTRHRPRRRGHGACRGSDGDRPGRERHRDPGGRAVSRHPPALGRQPARGRDDRWTGPRADDRGARRRAIARCCGGAHQGRVVHADSAPADLLVTVARRTEPEAGTIALADARVVVGGGRGVGSAEGFAALEELASLLGGTVGVSRAVTSAGWRPHAEQVGQTGQRIAPDLYIACGISGAIQHIVGCKAAKHILAINNDPEAPIMEKADSAVIGDLRTIVPAIILRNAADP